VANGGHTTSSVSVAKNITSTTQSQIKVNNNGNGGGAGSDHGKGPPPNAQGHPPPNSHVWQFGQGGGAGLGFGLNPAEYGVGALSAQVFVKGGIKTAQLSGTNPILVSAASGLLARALITTLGSGSWTLYDANTVGNAAFIIGVIPASAPVGKIYKFQMPIASGIVAVPTGSAGNVTLSYS
jgi:hypothetical protein